MSRGAKIAATSLAGVAALAVAAVITHQAQPPTTVSAAVTAPAPFSATTLNLASPSVPGPSSSPADRGAVPTATPSSAGRRSPGPAAGASSESGRIPPRFLGTNLTRLPTTNKVVALTFDCGGSKAGVRSILRTLAGADARATFFVTGDFVRSYPKVSRAIAAAGHVIGNHSRSHPDFLHLTTAQQQRQVQSAARRITAVTGESTKPWFRFPYGSFRGATVALVNDLGYAAIGWTVDSLGWQGTSGGQSARSVRNRVLAAATPGEIVLMHGGATPGDNSTLDADALPGIIRGLKARGYGFVSLSTTIGR